MFIRLFVRFVLIGIALVYALPYVEGVRFPCAQIIPVIITSFFFNLVFAALEWLLDVIVVGVNISTLSIGLIFTRFLNFGALILAPGFALYLCAKVLPYVRLQEFYPDAVVGGFVLGAVLFAHMVAEKRT